MPAEHDDTTTLREGATFSVPDFERVPGLTIASHFDLFRAGDRVALPQLLSSGVVSLSRSDLTFAARNAYTGEPLDDPYVSRRPLRFVGTSIGIAVSPPEGARIKVDGEPLVRTTTIEWQRLEQGAVFELGDRVRRCNRHRPSCAV